MAYAFEKAMSYSFVVKTLTHEMQCWLLKQYIEHQKNHSSRPWYWVGTELIIFWDLDLGMLFFLTFGENVEPTEVN